MKFDEVYALDLGTTKFCIARTVYLKNEPSPCIETVSIPSSGMHKGMLSNFEDAQVALSALIEKAEKQFNRDISKVLVGVAGSHLKGYITSVQSKIETQIINPTLLDSLNGKVRAKNLKESREILHVVPLAFKIDDREWISSPVGFSGDLIRGEYFVIESDKTYLTDIIRLCNNTGLEVKRLIAEPYASASVSGNPESRKVGVVIADIGGGTTDGIVFQSAKPVGAFTINIGGKLMTKDLSIGLGITYESAEKVKREFGLLPDRTNRTIEVIDVNGLTKSIVWQDVYKVLGPRISELGDHIKASIKPYVNSLGAGLLLTGGGSNLKNISNYLSKDLGVSTQAILPGVSDENDYSSLKLRELSAKYATVSGLLNVNHILSCEEKLNQKPSKTMRYFNYFVNWIKELS